MARIWVLLLTSALVFAGAPVRADEKDDKIRVLEAQVAKLEAELEAVRTEQEYDLVDSSTRDQDCLLAEARLAAVEALILEAISSSDTPAAVLAFVHKLEAKLAEATPKGTAKAPLDTAESVQDAAKRALAAVQKAGLVTESVPVVRVSSTSEVRRILEKEFYAQFKDRFDEQNARAEAEATAAGMAPSLFAKYVFATNEILIFPDALAEMAAVLDIPGLLTEEAICAILVHEYVHADDQRKHNIFQVACSRTSQDAAVAYNAVVEGNAQFMSRRISEQNGWSSGFDAFTGAIGQVVGFEDEPALRLLIEAAAALMQSAYYDGEKFVAAVHASGGEQAVAEALRNPPEEAELIFNPAWYIDPATRPKFSVDVKAGVKAFVAPYPEESWLHTFSSPSRAQLAAALGVLPPQDLNRILDSMRQKQIVVVQPRKDPASQMIVGSMFLFDTVESASFFMKAEQRVHELRDKEMSTGSVRVVSSEAEDVSGNGWAGKKISKEISVPGDTVVAKTVFARQGKAVIELLWSVAEVTDAELVEATERMFRSARKVPSEANDDSKGDG